MPRPLRKLLPVIAVLLGAVSCGGPDSSSGGARERVTIGVAFETLQTEFWVAAWNAFKSHAESRGITILQAVADGDPNKQLEQVRTFVDRRVNGIVIVPKDGKTVIPMIRAANRATIPMVLFNRPADRTDAPHTVVAPDNVKITEATVDYLIEQVRKGGTPVKAAVLLGDLSDVNAVGRRDGFDAAIEKAGDLVHVVATIPTEWNQEKALAGLQSALQANPDIGLIFTSSDFMFPSIKSVLSAAGKWKRVGEPGHVLLGGFDGDPTAYRLMIEGYVDATGVQDVFWEVEQATQVILDVKAGKPAPPRMEDPGFAITQANLKELRPRMWGARVAMQGR